MKWLFLAISAFAAMLTSAPAQAATVLSVSETINFIDQWGVNPLGVGTQIGTTGYYTGGTYNTFGALSITPAAGTTVTGTQGGVTYSVPHTGGGAFPNEFSTPQTVPYNPALTGPWTLTVTNPTASNSGLTVNTQTLTAPASPQPVAITSTTTSAAGTTLTWSIPTTGPVANYEYVSIFYPGITGQQYVTDALAAGTTSVTIAPSITNSLGLPVLSAGQQYVVAVQADIQGTGTGPGSQTAESRAFSPILTVPASAFTGTVIVPSVLPTPSAFGGPIFAFNTPVTAGTPILIDPAAAIGFIYQTGATDPNFASVELPNIGNPNPYSLYLWNGSTFVFDTTLAALTLFDFAPGGVSEFEILGIDPSLGLDPNNATDFVTQLTFTADGTFTGTMTPIEATPLPAALPLFATGLGAMGLLGWRRKRKVAAIAA